jgi:hypothetical protein
LGGVPVVCGRVGEKRERDTKNKEGTEERSRRTFALKSNKLLALEKSVGFTGVLLVIGWGLYYRRERRREVIA